MTDAGAMTKRGWDAEAIIAGVSRKIARHVPFKPHRVALDRPVVAFTFDDFPMSVVDNAVPALDDAGMRGTFYLAGGLMGRFENGQKIVEIEQVAEIARTGHEIGGHTHGHINVQAHRRPDLLADIARNDREIAEIVGSDAPKSFAYPFGMISVPSKIALMRRYPGLRGIKIGINAGITDLAHLKSQELYDAAQDSASLDRLLDETERVNGWTIFYAHDVRIDPTSIGCSPRLFAEAVEKVRRRGITVEPVIETLRRIGAPGA
jgi:peptidoglycan/xylan/chitin deacetylase (PgdA/CDA1 family)